MLSFIVFPYFYQIKTKHIMKIQSFIACMCAALAICTFSACSNSDDTEIELSFKEKEKIFLKDLREKVRGEWKVERMVIAKNHISGDSYNDSIITDAGNIFINNISNDPAYADKYNRLEAYFHMNNEVIPFKSKLLCLPSLSKPEIDEVGGLIESAYFLPFPVNSNDFSKEFQFLNHYFFGDNYIMTLSEDERSWTWKGLNQFVREIVLTRK